VDGVKLGHLSPGNLLYIPAGVPYSLKSKYLRCAVLTFDHTSDEPLPEERIPPVAADFKPELCHMAGVEAPFDKMLMLEDMESERDTFVGICNLFTSAEGCYRAQASAIFKQILLKVAETVDEHALPARMVEALDAYIRENYSDEISNTEIGAIFGYHPFYVSRILKDKKGITLRQYIISYRFKAAKKMLELTDKSIADIAEETGFTDASYFAKSFKSTFGITPKEYRNSFKDSFV
jgi:YesN/AraC family two-component response regulator